MVAIFLFCWPKAVNTAPLLCPVGCSCQSSHYLLCDSVNLYGFRVEPKAKLKAHTVSFRNSLHLDQSVLRCDALVDVKKMDISGTGYDCTEVGSTLRLCIDWMDSFRCDSTDASPNYTTTSASTTTTTVATGSSGKPDPTVYRRKKILVPKPPYPTTTTTTTISPPDAHGADVDSEGSTMADYTMSTTTTANETTAPTMVSRLVLTRVY